MRLMWFEHMTAQAIGPGLVQITTQATEAKAEARCRDVVNSHQRFPPTGAPQDDAITPALAQHRHRGIRVEGRMNSPFGQSPPQRRQQRRDQRPLKSN